MKLNRRRVPLFLAALDLIILSGLIFFDVVGEAQADKLTLLNMVIGYAVKTCVFGYMRQRMVRDSRDLTVFGWDLVDFFTALTWLAATLFLVTLGVYISLLLGVLIQPFELRVINRLALNFALILTDGTGIVVLVAMRSQERLDVHISPDQQLAE